MKSRYNPPWFISAVSLLFCFIDKVGEHCIMSAASFSLGSSLRSALHIDAALALIETGNMIPPSITVQTLKHVLKLHCYELFSRNMKE